MNEVLLFSGVVLLGLGLCAGIMLIITGLRRKRPAMWVGGIIICLLGALSIAVGNVFIRAESRRQVQTIHDEWAHDDIKEWSGLTFPKGFSVKFTTQHSAVVQNELKEFTTYQLSVPPGFHEFLAANFTKAQWQDVVPVFQAGRLHPQSVLPTDSQLQAMPLYITIRRMDARHRSVTIVGHDPDRGQAWVVIAFEKIPESASANGHPGQERNP